MEDNLKVKWADVKEFVSSLSDEQLQQEVKVEVVEDSVYSNVHLGIVEEDIYMRDKDVDDIGTLAELKEIHDKEFDETDCVLIVKKGTVYISADN